MSVPRHLTFTSQKLCTHDISQAYFKIARVKCSSTYAAISRFTKALNDYQTG